MENNTNRRNFIKKAAIGTVAVTGLSGWTSKAYTSNNITSVFSTNNILTGSSNVKIALTEWKIDFDEQNSFLSLNNGAISLAGKFLFTSGNEVWSISNSRDGIHNRYALVDTKGDVQGYFVFLPNGSKLEVLFYHRTAQSYQGELSFAGDISFPKDAFPCRTQAQVGERVLGLSSGETNSLLNDSLFSPENDLLLQLKGADLRVIITEDGNCTFSLKGRIEESAEALFSITIEPDYFQRRYVPYYHPLNRERCPKAPTGWMSWNTYFDKATAKDNLDEAKIGVKYLLPFGCEFWSIESWQGNSDQLPVSDFYNMDLEVNKKQFPKGMKKLADDIRALGFRPGIWMAPFGTGNKEFYNKHKDWFLHDKGGTPIRSWNGQYTLDPTVNEAREHLKGIFRIASREWGYEFFKVDGMSGRNRSYCAHLYERPEVRERFKDPACPNPFELCVWAFREGIGEDRVLLACQGHSSGPEALYADAARLGADIVHPNQPVQWANVMNQGKCFINQAFTHNICMVADPDTLLVHDLPIEEARVTATIVALPGQLTFFGDKLARLSKERMKMLQQTLPVANVRPVSLYPYFSMLPVWNLSVKHKELGNYNVVALFNWEDNTKTIEVTAKELGIDAANGYIAYEFWTEKSVPLQADHALPLAMNVPAHGVRVVVLSQLKSTPQWIGSDRHIAQNGMEMLSCHWNESDTALEGAIQLVGDYPLTMRVHIPDDYAYKQVICDSAKSIEKKESENILSITFLADKSKDVPFRITFRTT